MKTIVTHVRPHLDEIVAIWLLKRYHPDFSEPDFEFYPAGELADGKTPDGREDSDDVVFLGVGMGRFDEHRAAMDETAADLLWAWIQKTGLVDVADLEKTAIKKLLEFNRQEDKGELRAIAPDLRDFLLPGFLEGYRNATGEDDQKYLEFGLQILTGIFEVLKGRGYLRKTGRNGLNLGRVGEKLLGSRAPLANTTTWPTVRDL